MKTQIVFCYSLLIFFCLSSVRVSTSETLSKPPSNPDTSAHYLFYLHGRIIEDSKSLRPKSSKYGFYEYEKILKALERNGFIVIADIRNSKTNIKNFVLKIGNQVKELLDSGVPPNHINIVGASKGGAIAAFISNNLKNKNVNFVILAGLFKSLSSNKLTLWGNILSIHDRADKSQISPDLFLDKLGGKGKHKKIILNLGIGHGLLYKPYPEWVNPLVDWSGINKKIEQID